MRPVLHTLTVFALLAVASNPALAQQPTPQERVVALKASLAASQAILKQYEWVETTVVSVKGEEKSRQMNRCYYGDDGKVQKVPLTQPPPEEKKRGLLGRVAEKKQEEMTDYMKQAVALVKEYVPPQPVLIQKAKDAGTFTVSPQPGQRARLTFSDYLKPGDSFALDVDLASNRPAEAKVSTYLDSKDEPVTLDVKFGTLDSNATYASTIVLDAKAKNLSVNVQNSGYRKSGN
jgi:hypothetical protein